MSWANAWRIARRDLNARFKGLRLLLVCIFLGTAALAAIGSLTAAIERELEANGQTFLGGDIQIELWQRSLNAEERGALEELGTVSSGTRLQAMARKDDLAAPIELKAVDEAYPLYGDLVLEGAGQETCPARGAEAGRGKAVVKDDPLAGQLVEKRHAFLRRLDVRDRVDFPQTAPLLRIGGNDLRLQIAQLQAVRMEIPGK